MIGKCFFVLKKIFFNYCNMNVLIFFRLIVIECNVIILILNDN